MTENRERREDVEVETRESVEPEESASNSAQAIEARDKSRQTHNPSHQQSALRHNVKEHESHVAGIAQQPAGQHATGSFTGNEQDSRKEKNP
jgi:hypothetical protein